MEKAEQGGLECFLISFLALQIVILMILIFVGDSIYSVVSESERHLTIVFNSFVFLQVFNIFTARTLVDSLFAFFLSGFGETSFNAVDCAS